GHLFEPAMRLLAARFTVHAPDLPGHGDSTADPAWAPDLVGFAKGLLDALELPRSHLVGSSIGGAIAARLAASEPARVERLVLVSPVGAPPDEVERARRALPDPGAGLAAFRRQFCDPALATRAL